MDEIRSMAGPIVQRHFEKVEEERRIVQERVDAEKAAKRAKKDRKKKDRAVLEGVELPDDRKIKRGWTEPPGKSRKEKKDKDKEANVASNSNKDGKPTYSFMAVTEYVESDWIADSGAESHFVVNANAFSSYRMTPGQLVRGHQHFCTGVTL